MTFSGENNGISATHDYIVVARRYRPQNFQELVGQDQVTQALQSAISTGRVGHAYLFTGARGVGKTSAARILAKALQCVDGPTPTPCSACDICQAIASGDDVDVLEIDGASNRGIDEIRQLRSNVNIRPSRCRFKIYIIDEVHMLTSPAFNALLKTLEEPPEHVKFIFCTTDPEKIPITVLSRCQRFDFSGIRPVVIVDRLRQIATAEDAKIEDEALKILAWRAAGSMRDSQSLLEQLLAFGGESIGADEVHQMLGTATTGRLLTLLDCLVRPDAGAALRELDLAIHEGVDAGPLLDQLLGLFRDMMAAAVGCDDQLLMHGAAADLTKLTDRMGLEAILAAIQILDQTALRMRQSTHARTLVELAVVRIAQLCDLEEISTLIAQLREGDSAASGPTVRPATSGKKKISSKRLDVAASASSQPSPTEHNKTELGQTQQTRLDQPQIPHISFDGDNAIEIWRAAANQLTDTSEQALKFSCAAISAPNRLVISFERRYDSAKAFCEMGDRRGRLENVLREVTGQAIRLEFELLEDASPRPSSRTQFGGTRRQQMWEVAGRPLVRSALNLFDAEIMRIEEPRDQIVHDPS